MKIGLLGAGYIALHHANALKAYKDLTVTAVCDSNLSRAKAIADLAGCNTVYASLEEMLQAQKFDCIHNLLPPDLHAITSKKILEAGTHVFLEKPMGINEQECQALKNQADKLGLKLGINHNFLFFHPYESLKNAIHEGKLGPINHITMTWQKPLDQIKAGPFHNWMLKETKNTFIEVFPHLATCILDLMGTPENLWSEPSDPVVLPNGVTLFRRWMIGGHCGRTYVQMRIAFNPGFEEHSLAVRGVTGYGYVDFERNLCVIRRHTAASRPFDLYNMTKGEAHALASQGKTNLVNYILKKLKFRSFGDPYAESIGASIRCFYDSLKKDIDSRQSAALAIDVIKLTEEALKTLPPSKPNSKINHVHKNQLTPKILVTGGTGFIGKELIKELLAANQAVRVIARDPSKLDLNDSNLDIVNISLTNEHSLSKAFQGIEVVYHLARVHAKSWKEYLEGVETTRLLAETALSAGVKRFIYTGTIDTYYGGKAGEVITERTPIDSKISRRNLYAQAKAKEELLLTEMYATKQLPLVIVRPGIVIGPGTSPCHWGVGMWYYDTICHFWGKGNNPLPFVLVNDVAKGLILAGKISGIDGECFNLVDIPCLTAQEYVNELSNAAGIDIEAKKHAIWRYYGNESFKWIVKLLVRHPDRRLPSYHDWASRSQLATYDCFKARKVLGWYPASNKDRILEAGIRESAKLWIS